MSSKASGHLTTLRSAASDSNLKTEQKRCFQAIFARYLCQICVLAIWSREALAIYHLKSARGVDNMSTFSVKAPSAQPQDGLAGLR